MTPPCSLSKLNSQCSPPTAGNIAFYSTDFSDSAMLTFSSFPLMKRFVSRAKTTVITKLSP